MKNVMSLLFICLIGSLYGQKITTVVEDKINLLTNNQRSLLVDRINSINKDGITRVVIYIDSKSEMPIFDMAQSIYDENKIGTKDDDGVLILVLKDDRKVRIHTGYGVEDILPDVICERIIRDIITPQFKKGDFYNGLNLAINEIEKKIDEKDVFNKTENRDIISKQNNISIIYIVKWILLIIIIFIIFLVLYENYKDIITKYKFRRLLNLYSDRVYFNLYEDEWEKIRYRFIFSGEKYDTIFQEYYKELIEKKDIKGFINSVFAKHKKIYDNSTIKVKDIRELENYLYALNIIEEIKSGSLQNNHEDTLSFEEKNILEYFQILKDFDLNDKLNEFELQYYNIIEDVNLLYNKIINNHDIQKNSVYNFINTCFTYNSSIRNLNKFVNSVNKYCFDNGLNDIDYNIDIIIKKIQKLHIDEKSWLEKLNITKVEIKSYDYLSKNNKYLFYNNLNKYYSDIVSIIKKYNNIKSEYNTLIYKLKNLNKELSSIDSNHVFFIEKEDIEMYDINSWLDEKNKLKNVYDSLNEKCIALKKKITNNKNLNHRKNVNYNKSTLDTWGETKKDNSSNDSIFGGSYSNHSYTSNDSYSSDNNDSFSSGGGDSGGGGADGSW